MRIVNIYDGKVGILGIVHHGEILFNKFAPDRVIGVLLIFFFPEAYHGRIMALGQIDACLGLHGQCSLMVLDHHNRAQLSLITFAHELGIAYYPFGLLRVHIGVFKQA